MKQAVTLCLFAVVLGTTGCASLGLRCEDDYCGPEPGSAEWWEAKASLPVGARQRFHNGKVWPPFVRPTGEAQQFSHRFHAAHYWPYPYVCEDRAFMKNLWEEQAASGWMDATTLYDYHFDPQSDELNDPGLDHLNWVMHTIPEKRRIIFVQGSYENEISAGRLQAVQQAAAEMAANEEIPAIVLRMTMPLGRPAVEVDMIRQGALNSFPIPRVPSALTGGPGGGGGGAGGGQGAAGL